MNRNEQTGQTGWRFYNQTARLNNIWERTCYIPSAKGTTAYFATPKGRAL